MAIKALLILDQLTDEPHYQQTAHRALSALLPLHQRHGIFVGALGTALYQALYPPLKIELAGQPQSIDFQDWHRTARTIFSPGKIMRLTPQPDLVSPEARLCIGTQCLQPVKTLDELTNLIG